jgi:hypothetical protein
MSSPRPCRVFLTATVFCAVFLYAAFFCQDVQAAATTATFTQKTEKRTITTACFEAGSCREFALLQKEITSALEQHGVLERFFPRKNCMSAQDGALLKALTALRPAN